MSWGGRKGTGKEERKVHGTKSKRINEQGGKREQYKTKKHT